MDGWMDSGIKAGCFCLFVHRMLIHGSSISSDRGTDEAQALATSLLGRGRCSPCMSANFHGVKPWVRGELEEPGSGRPLRDQGRCQLPQAVCPCLQHPRFFCPSLPPLRCAACPASWAVWNCLLVFHCGFQPSCLALGESLTFSHPESCGLSVGPVCTVGQNKSPDPGQ